MADLLRAQLVPHGLRDLLSGSGDHCHLVLLTHARPGGRCPNRNMTGRFTAVKPIRRAVESS
jgi:hypothetical protein